MKYRRLDENGDMLPVTAINAHLEGREAVGAAIRSRLLSFQGEWWEDPEDGVPMESFFGRVSDERSAVLKALLRQRVAETEGVTQVIDLQINDDPETRKKTVYIEVETEFGETTVEVG